MVVFRKKGEKTMDKRLGYVREMKKTNRWKMNENFENITNKTSGSLTIKE